MTRIATRMSCVTSGNGLISLLVELIWTQHRGRKTSVFCMDWLAIRTLNVQRLKRKKAVHWMAGYKTPEWTDLG